MTHLPLRSMLFFSLSLFVILSPLQHSHADDLPKTVLFEARDGLYHHYRIPGIITTSQGTLLAYCEARKAAGDWANIDILMRRSTDGGKTWLAPQTIHDAKENTVNNVVAFADAQTGQVHLLYCENYGRCFYIDSKDDGKTFSDPVEITRVFEQFRKEYDWNVIATGPGHGIQLQNGRLLVPVWLSIGGKKHRPSSVATIFSDDHGKTWQRGDIIVKQGDTVAGETVVNPSETVAVQLFDNQVLVNIRTESNPHRRLVAVSDNGATNWISKHFDDQLREPVCMASILRLPASKSQPRNAIVFANPDNLENKTKRRKPNRDRKNLTLQVSFDDCQTWASKQVLEPGISGYSDLAALPDGTIFCFYEDGGFKNNGYDTTALTIARFPLKWILQD
ncbi:Sialidase precursor [Gimesia maris]|uniref:sialidase family protein n=1 Tax=Gimesia maris TaxID=122 RepID=UPI0011891B38|nr:sialidase family protein [Gimesia maris]QDT79005.1 Sialidase precursor [Gimesia maris]